MTGKMFRHQHALKQIGDDFLKKQEHLLMKVPSSIVPMEYNYLLNTATSGYEKSKNIKEGAF